MDENQSQRTSRAGADQARTRRELLGGILGAAALGVGVRGAAAQTAGRKAVGWAEPVVRGLPDETTTGSRVELAPGIEPDHPDVREYIWILDNGVTTRGRSPTRVWTEPGEYEIALLVVYADGSMASDTGTVRVIDAAPTVAVSTTFEATGDRFRAVVELDDPAVLDRADVDRVTVTRREFPSYRVVDATGFSSTGDGTWTATRGDPPPSITLECAVASAQRFTGEFEGADYYPLDRFVPKVDVAGADSTTVEHDFRVVAPGFTSTSHDDLYFGESDRYDASTADGDLALVVPDGIETAADSDLILRALSEYAAAYDPSPTDGATTAIALPPTEVPGSERGQTIGDAFWADANAPVDAVGSVWLHEFAHVAERIDGVADSLSWFREGYAQYRSYLAPLELAHGPHDSSVFEGARFETFASHLDPGGRIADLSDPADYGDDDEHYHYGAAVLGAVDRAIREATGTATLGDVVERLHDRSEPDHSDLLSIVTEVADGDVALDANDWIRATAVPEVWSAAEHEAAFGYPV